MSLLIEDPEIKLKYFYFIKNDLKVPVCKSCKKLFNLGFPKEEEALPDYFICVANELICICENSKKIDYLTSGDSSISIIEYYDY